MNHALRAGGGAAGRDDGAAALGRLDSGLLVVLWLGSLLGRRRLPQRIPVHFDHAGQPDGWTTHDAGGLLLWLLLPVIALLTSLVLRWACRLAEANPGHWSIPRKAEFLALDADARAPIVVRLVRFMALVGVLTTTLLGMAQLTIYLSATGRSPDAAVILWVVLGCTALILVLALRLARQVSADVAQASSRSDAGRGVTGAIALLVLAVACAPAARTEAPEPAARVEATDTADTQEPARATRTAGADSLLRAELLAMGAADQAVREGLTPETIQDTAFLKRLVRTDSAHSIRLREIVATSGWPDAARVGRDAVHAAFLIVQHSPFDDFRERMLPYVERDVRAGVLDGQDYAAMVDRIRTHRGEPQLYGTQYTLVDGVLRRDPVEDPDGLDARRAGLGLMPIAEYERRLSEFYGAPVRPPSTQDGDVNRK